jgi:hypothetical protein
VALILKLSAAKVAGKHRWLILAPRPQWREDQGWS